MARTARGSGGAISDKHAHRVYLIEELSLTGGPQSPAIVKVGRAGLDSDKARRACERGNARTLVVRYVTDPLTVAEAMKVERTVHRWLHAQALQREWFGCPNVAFAQLAIDRALHHIRNPETGQTELLWPSTEPTAPDSPIALMIAALRSHRTQALNRGKVGKALGYEQQIDRLQRGGHARLSPTDAVAR